MFRRFDRALVLAAAALLLAALIGSGQARPLAAQAAALPTGREVVDRHVAAIGGIIGQSRRMTSDKAVAPGGCGARAARPPLVSHFPLPEASCVSRVR